MLGFSSGPPIVPSEYNNILQVFQTPDYVVIFTEMVHEARSGALAAPALHGAAPAHATESAVVAADGSFDSAGVQIHYSDNGDGEAVVLVHGLLGNHQQWQPIATALVDAGYRVVAIDARGHGQSDKPVEDGQYGVHMVEDVTRLLDHLGLDRVHLAHRGEPRRQPGAHVGDGR